MAPKKARSRLLSAGHAAIRRTSIKASDLHYDLPPDRIAQHALPRRDDARLLVLYGKSGALEHRVFRDLPEYLRPGDCLVFNRSRVLPARFEARRPTGGRRAALFLTESAPGRWRVLMEGAGKFQSGEVLAISGGHWSMTWLRHCGRGICDVRIDPPDPAATVLERVGSMPLPPYIRRDGSDAGEAAADRRDYQTIYADREGSVAAPTAGLHFTEELIVALRERDVATAYLTLHVGLGTFAPVDVENLADHRMHSEWYDLSRDAFETIQRARAAAGRTVAVGTTSVRVLETCARRAALAPASGWTDLLIYPPYDFRATDALITNFHLPGSTLLALVFAFAGREQVLHAYRAAIDEGYRFYSYGDAMLIL